MTSIGNSAFYGCKNIETVTCNAEKPLNLELDVFGESNVGDATLYVPDASVELYKAADQWKEFGAIKGLSELPTSIETITAMDVALTSSRKYLQDGRIVIRKDGRTYNVAGVQVSK